MALAGFTNVFAGGPLDRASERRLDLDWLAARLSDPRSTALALWNGQPLLTGSETEPKVARISAELANVLAVP